MNSVIKSENPEKWVIAFFISLCNYNSMNLYKNQTFNTLCITLTFLVGSLSSEIYGQSVTLPVKADLPSVLDESSGLEVTNKNSIWSHNDSSGDPKLYNFDSTGTLLRTLTLLNTSNNDWEDVAIDTAGNFYIGDIGNNNNDRQDLQIYIIPSPTSIIDDTVSPQIINYTYSDQYDFPPEDSMKNFDAEAMIAFNDSLYIFSKDRSDPYSGYTKLYRLPNTAGTYVAQLVDSFYTGPGPQQVYSITSADISPNQSRLILLGYNRCWIFTDFIGSDFFSGTIKMLEFTDFSQKEGLCFITENELYITDELNSGIGQKLYYLNIASYYSTVGMAEVNASELSVFPNPFSESVSVKLNLQEQGSYQLSVYNQVGQQLLFKTIVYTNSNNTVQIDKTVFNDKPGVYFVEIAQHNKPLFYKRLVKIKG
jgi:hypothetical protein